MSAKQGSGGNKIDAKRLCLYALLTAAAMVTGYIESLFPLVFIAPGVKLGLANAVSLILAVRGDFKGAFFVNTVRILLSALLFGSAVSLAFSFCAGTVSLLCIILLSRTKKFSAIGLSCAGGVVHNAVQCAVAVIFVGGGTVYYLPVLIAAGVFSGAVVGILSELILKKVMTKGK